ncbi:MAG: hypothetical protein RJB13_271 [Pseudomonadota bacterium]|jgi:hypothetical protein
MLNSPCKQSSWNHLFFEQGGLFDLFQPWSQWILQHDEAFPSLEELTALLLSLSERPILSGGGFQLKFVRQQRAGRGTRRDLGWRADYQMRIFLSGEVPTRPANWHDFFNAWSWIFFPRSKAALNLRHFMCADELYEFPWRRAAMNRNAEQDFLTLFDEGGLVVVCDDDDLWKLIQERRWVELFLENRQRLLEEVAFLPLGHALFDCALAGNPKIHASVIRVKASLHGLKKRQALSKSEELTMVDELLAHELNRRSVYKDTNSLYALPIWGIPGWSRDSERPEFFFDKNYFR